MKKKPNAQPEPLDKRIDRIEKQLKEIEIGVMALRLVLLVIAKDAVYELTRIPKVARRAMNALKKSKGKPPADPAAGEK